MTNWIEPFEGLGENCEFGFVQRALGYEVSSLLRWAYLDSVDATIAGIANSFSDAFRFENLEPAANGTMVRDSIHGIAFHTAMRAERTESGWAFLATASDRHEIYLEELKKFRYLQEKFDQAIVTSDRIYVVKRNDGLALTEAEALCDVVGKRGGNRLLYVTAGRDGEQTGTARLVNGRLARGIVERFAPHTQADDITLSSWEAVLRAALNCFGV